MKKREKVFSGVCTALVTPFSKGAIDFPALDTLIEAQIEGGVSAICICGTTGEAVTLTEEERQTLVAHALRRIGGRVKTLVGVGSPATQTSISYASHAWGQGADALLLSTPYYNKGTKEGITRHFHRVADATTLPVILYHVPSRTGVRLSVPHVEEIVSHPNIVGIKEADDSVERLASLMHHVGDRVHLYAGNDSAFLPALSLGAEGVISVISNLLPTEWCEVWHLFQKGNLREAAQEVLRLQPLIEHLFSETNPAPIKACLHLTGMIQNELRLPLAPVSPPLLNALKHTLGLD